MRKQLGLLTTLIVLLTTALVWAGCNSNYGCYDDCCREAAPCCETACAPAPVCAQAPVCAPRCAAPVCRPCPPRCAPPACAPAPCKGSGSSEICCDGVIVTATQPKLCILGDNYILDLCVKACVDVCHVDVNAMLPDGVSLVRSEPEGAVGGPGRISWSFDSMKRGEVRHSRVTLRADREGDLCVCFCVTAVPVQFCTILCAKPLLECSKCGPEEVCPGDPVHYVITVTNKGSCAAEQVVVTDNVPDGLEHSSGLRTLTFKLGTIEACQTKKINVCFQAVKRGKVCNRITVTACNASPTNCEACTCICKCAVDLMKTGPKEVSIGKNADYQIVVSNVGDKPLTDVILTDTAPSATSIVEARGAQVNGNQAVWRFNELKPGERQTFGITLTTCTPGYFVNRVHVDNCQHCTACAEAGTRWKGRAALNMCLESPEGSICIGEVNTYTIRVTNQGSEEDNNVKLVVRFPKEIVPVNIAGGLPGNIQGQTVTFEPIRILGQRQTIEVKIDGRAKESGDARIKAEVSSDSIKTPIVAEENTVVS